MRQYRVPVVVEVMLERVTNVAMGTEINNITEFEDLAAGKADDWGRAVAVARESLDSGRAKQALSRLVETSKG